jgi:hypothetical protein
MEGKMNKTTYTVRAQDGSVLRSGLTAVEAAQEILGYDGRVYDLRRDRFGWQLYISRFSRCSYGGHGGLVEAYSGNNLIYSLASSEDEAWEDVANQVIEAGLGGLTAEPDAEAAEAE